MPRPDPYRAFRFLVEFDGLEMGGFQSVGGIESDTKVEPFHEGGVNGHEIQHIGLTTYPRLKLKRGLVDRQLWTWHQDVVGGTVKRKTLSIVLIDAEGKEAWRWIAVGAYPAKWTGADLDATQNALATESIEFVHHGLSAQ
ncbi:MAG TPA: phage tail protein [Allosphingosinicella sp.]|nr:phage tail protein [Allosphingosinicella sp.]